MLYNSNIFTRLAMCAIVSCLPAQVTNAQDVVSGGFELVDHDGNRVTERSFDGKLRLVFFGFTQCPDVCPTTMIEVRDAMRQLGDDASQVQPLFISIDREHDTIETIAGYVHAFGPEFVGLTGSRTQIDAAAAAFNVTYGVQPGTQSTTGTDTIFHSAYLFLMDRQGLFLDVFGYGTKADVIADKIRLHL